MTPHESEVYLALLRLGSSTTTNIVKESKVHASKIYSILDRLIEKGLASKVTKDQKAYYQSSDPEMIQVYLKNKQKNIDSQLKEVQDLIPQLRNLKERKFSEEEVQVFFGWKGLESAFRTILNTLKQNEIQYAIGGLYLEEIPSQNNFFESFRKERDKKKINTKIIFSKSAKGKFPSYEESKFTEIRYMDQEIPTYFDICKDRVLISLIKKVPIVIQIKSQEIADSFLSYFNIMWKISKP